jgi:hypothetical protein
MIAEYQPEWMKASQGTYSIALDQAGKGHDCRLLFNSPEVARYERGREGA